MFLNVKGKIDVVGVVGKMGILFVIKMVLGDKILYIGEVNLVLGELGDDFIYYLV